MKIDRKNYKHWLTLLLSSIYILLSLVFRPFRPRKRKTVVLYGHKLNGNLKAFADYYSNRKNNFKLYYATLDPSYYQKLQEGKPPVPVLSLIRFRDTIKIAQSEAVITDHGTHSLWVLLRMTNTKFIDVWHGIGFKGQKAKSYESKDRYTEHWVTSAAFRKMWVELFKRDPLKVKVTGYARVDALVKGGYKTESIKKKYGIDNRYKKIITVAPTWQDSTEDSSVPFGLKPNEFFSALDSVAQKLNSLIIFRVHLNVDDKSQAEKFKNIKVMSHKKYPQTEEFLAITDVLVSDWSSIVFDYLVLHRPTIFLDIPEPKQGFSLDPKYRFGEIVKNMDELLGVIEKYANSPKLYMDEHRKDINRSEKMAYDDTLDGKSAQRYNDRLQKLIY